MPILVDNIKPKYLLGCIKYKPDNFLLDRGTQSYLAFTIIGIELLLHEKKGVITNVKNTS